MSSFAASPALLPQWISTFAGSELGGTDGPLDQATFYQPSNVRMDARGRLWVVEATSTGFWTSKAGAHRIRRIETDGIVTTVAGSSDYGSADGLGSRARFQAPVDIIFDSRGNAFVTDFQNHRIRKIDPAGAMTTFAGSSEGYQDGRGANARFNLPIMLAIDSSDNVFVADFGNLAIRKITPDGAVTTYAGAGRGFRDGPRLRAQFDSPNGLALARDGTMYVSDWNNGALRKISPDGAVSTLLTGYGYMEQISLDRRGNLLISHYLNGRRKVHRFGPDLQKHWTIDCDSGFRDGEIGAAQYQSVSRLEPLRDGSLLFADPFNQRLRLILFAPPPAIEAPIASIGSPSVPRTDLSDQTVTVGNAPPAGTPMAIDRALALDDGSFLVEFDTLKDRLYQVQYSSDFVTWKTAVPAIPGTGSRVQWHDNGPPKTESRPGALPTRFYRIVLLP